MYLLAALVLAGGSWLGAMAHGHTSRASLTRAGAPALNAVQSSTHRTHRALPVDVPTLL
jgi:hypothetical protein